MSQEKKSKNLVIPAIRQYMGDWVYYSASMTMGEVDERVRVAEEIHEGSNLEDKIQRDLLDEKRAPKIKKYLERQEQRFFNSFVIGIYGGEPQWYEIDVKEKGLPYSDEEIPERFEGAFGILLLEGDETLFAIDGQHRVAGIRKAIEDGVGIKDEEVSALFVAHERSEKGRRRTRRLFTTLNRYAKPVRKHEAIALDEDDVVAIATRKVIHSHPLLDGRTALNKTKSINRRDKKNFTSLVAVYDALDVVLREGSKSDWEEFKKIRPEEKKIENMVEKSHRLFDILCEEFSSLKDYLDMPITDGIAESYRNRVDGGHLLFRPVGLLLVVQVARYLIDDSDYSFEEALRKVSNIPTSLNQKPWTGLLWDEANHRMITSRENQRAATRMTLYALGGDLSRFRSMSTESELKNELSGVYNIPEEEVNIPDFE